ncbi:MAG TPA: hypothetical protein VK589_29985 [Chryseolinea sp.]|nr:hypothetical protein [Chryseolinea sp.]
MNTVTKVIGVAALVAIVVWGVNAAKKAIADFQFDIVAYGKPTLSGMMLTVPLQIKFNNPTPLPISIDKFVADVYIDKNNVFVPGARIDQPISIPPGESTQWAFPVLNLPGIFGGNAAETAIFLSKIIATKTIKLRSDLNAVYKGISLPSQSFTNTVNIA